MTTNPSPVWAAPAIKDMYDAERATLKDGEAGLEPPTAPTDDTLLTLTRKT